ncbi:MAG: hypothetical protein ACOCU6_01290 [Nanoarchaeota archaeon]
MDSEKTLSSRAFQELYPDRKQPLMSISYSARFNEYNANVKIVRSNGRRSLHFSLSDAYRTCEEDIRIGVVQHLLNRVNKTSIPTLEQELYESFLKNVTRYVRRQASDPLLVELFDELNKEYFNDIMEQPSMIFGAEATTTLGHYNFTLDRVSISSALKPRRDLIKYVLYHELLHKKHSFKTANLRTQYHTSAFREDEMKFADKKMDQRLNDFLKRKRKKRILSSLLDWK